VGAKYLRPAARRDVIALLPSKGEAAPGQPVSESFTFPREARLVRKSEFDAVYRAGKRRSNSHYTIFARANQLPVSRFGFSIKKALGGAVLRNRIRRRLREIVRGHRREMPAGWDIVVHPKGSVATAPFAALTSDLLRLVKNL
jgi:ribonuclease P protein component